MIDFCDSLERYLRRKTDPVRVGCTVIGGENPIVVQSMTNTDTLDTEGCVAQTERIVAAGGPVVRLTAPGRREGENLRAIRDALQKRGVWPDRVALVADIHFTPEVAMIAAEYVDKVRINPGNYRDEEGEKLRALIARCRERGVALRIGVNHGSLAPRMVDRWGDTPRGMVESAMEMLRVCRDENFHDAVVSMKSSNVRVMVHAYRMLVAAMRAEGMRYPLHLGVTEAGDGTDGRVKSAVGIGTLLADGLGDTVRVSLTEPPENEIPVARELVACFADRSEHEPVEPITDVSIYSPYEYRRRGTDSVGRLGGTNVPLLYEELNEEEHKAIDQQRVVVLESTNRNPVADWRARILNLTARGDRRPVILCRRYREDSLLRLQVRAASDFGPLFVDGLADGIRIENEGEGVSPQQLRELALGILQAARVRMSKTEYIACPGCGRTLYDLQKTLATIRARTSHLKGLKIGVMGCIVNGPGEMADADYGYVGAGRGRVTLYKGREVVRRAIPQEEALDALVELIREGGDWTDPEP